MTFVGWWQRLTLITRFLGLVGWQGLTLITRFLSASTSAKKKPGFYVGAGGVARVDARNPVSCPWGAETFKVKEKIRLQKYE
jgi:hypothetical protein